MLPIVFTDGVSLGPDHCVLIAELATEELEGEARDLIANSVVLYLSQSKVKRVIKLDCTVTAIAVSCESEQQVFVSGSLGFIGRITSDHYMRESIEGPRTHGFICDLRVIGSNVYAAGMGRQVYRRTNLGNWIPIHQGVINKPKHYLDVTGFESIDGVSEDEIYAAGFNGEIWRYHKEEWQAIDSPTNLTIERVRATSSGKVYACGQQGILLRGRGDAWNIIRHDETEDDFWGLEWFRGRLYLATHEELFILNDHDELKPVVSGLLGPRTYSQLHVGQDTLWSFGAKHLAWTKDGETWHDVVLG